MKSKSLNLLKVTMLITGITMTMCGCGSSKTEKTVEVDNTSTEIATEAESETSSDDSMVYNVKIDEVMFDDGILGGTTNYKIEIEDGTYRIERIKSSTDKDAQSDVLSTTVVDDTLINVLDTIAEVAKNANDNEKTVEPTVAMAEDMNNVLWDAFVSLNNGQSDQLGDEITELMDKYPDQLDDDQFKEVDINVDNELSDNEKFLAVVKYVYVPYWNNILEEDMQKEIIESAYPWETMGNTGSMMIDSRDWYMDGEYNETTDDTIVVTWENVGNGSGYIQVGLRDNLEEEAYTVLVENEDVIKQLDELVDTRKENYATYNPELNHYMDNFANDYISVLVESASINPSIVYLEDTDIENAVKIYNSSVDEYTSTIQSMTLAD